MIEAVVGVALRAVLASVVLGGALALCVLAATRALALTASTRHALWTTALIAMGVMPLAGIGISLAKGAAPAAAAVHVVRDTPSAPRRAVSAPATHAANGGDTAHAANATRAGASSPSFRAGDGLAIARDAVAGWTPRVSRTIALGASGVWAIGALAGLFGLAASLVRVHGLKRRSSPLDGELADELPWLTEVGPGREIYLRLSYETETPVAIGFRRPVILIPTELATADGLAAIEPLVLHEYAHLRRYDDWTNLVQRAIERLFWFNPIVWVVGRRIALEREIASDDAVIEKTGEPHAYATSLWKLAREMRMPEHAVVAPGALLTRKQISVRIERLLDKNRSRLHRSPAAAFAVTCAALIAVAVVASSAPAVELPAAAIPNATSDAAARTSNVAVHTNAAAVHHAVHTEYASSAVAHKRVAVHQNAPAEFRVSNVSSTTTSNTTIAPTSRVVTAAGKRTGGVRDRITVEHVTIAQTPALPTTPPLPPMPAMPVPPVPPLPADPANATATKRVVVRMPLAIPIPQHIPGLGGIGPQISAEVERAMHDAMAAIPAQIAQESGGAPGRRTRFDGVKLSRELVASCTGCSFRNADLRGLDLHDLRISANDFSGADMRGTNLSGAKLSGVSLARANLGSADLRGAQLSGVELTRANFEGALLDGIKLIGVSLQHVNLRGTMLRSVIANCTGCDFNRLDLHGQDLHGITLNGADLSHADLHDANLSGVRFSGVDLSHANLGNADLTNAHLDGCDLSGADFRGAHTAGMTMRGSGLDG